MSVVNGKSAPSLNDTESYVMIEKTVSPDYLDAISKDTESISDDLRTINLSIHDNPELQFKEFHAHRVLTEYLQKQDGWKVTPSAYDHWLLVSVDTVMTDGWVLWRARERKCPPNVWNSVLKGYFSLGDLKYKPFGVTPEPEVRSQLLHGKHQTVLHTSPPMLTV